MRPWSTLIIHSATFVEAGTPIPYNNTPFAARAQCMIAAAKAMLPHDVTRGPRSNQATPTAIYQSWLHRYYCLTVLLPRRPRCSESDIFSSNPRFNVPQRSMWVSSRVSIKGLANSETQTERHAYPLATPQSSGHSTPHALPRVRVRVLCLSVQQ